LILDFYRIKIVATYPTMTKNNKRRYGLSNGTEYTVLKNQIRAMLRGLTTDTIKLHMITGKRLHLFYVSKRRLVDCFEQLMALKRTDVAKIWYSGTQQVVGQIIPILETNIIDPEEKQLILEKICVYHCANLLYKEIPLPIDEVEREEMDGAKDRAEGGEMPPLIPIGWSV